jgi:hypothetical protein
MDERLLRAFILTLAFTSLCHAEDTGDGVRVSLRERAVATGKVLLLGDLARVEGPEEKVCAIQSVTIGLAPVAGRSRRITLGYVKMRLRAEGVEPEQLVFEGPSEVVVSTPAVPPRLSAPRGGEADDLQWRFRTTTRGSETQGLPTATSVTGCTVATSSEAGEEAWGLFSGDKEGLCAPMAVERGQPLVVRCQYGLVQVRAEAVAQQPGRLGDVVEVQLRTNSRQKILVRIIGPGLGEVLR